MVSYRVIIKKLPLSSFFIDDLSALPFELIQCSNFFAGQSLFPESHFIELTGIGQHPGLQPVEWRTEMILITTDYKFGCSLECQRSEQFITISTFADRI